MTPTCWSSAPARRATRPRWPRSGARTFRWSASPSRDQAPKPEVLAPVRTILAVTDFSPAGNAAIPEAYRLLRPTGGDVVLAHVAKPERFGLDPTRQEEIETCLLGLVPQDVDQTSNPHPDVRDC